VRKAFILIPILLVGLAGLFFLLRPTASAPVASSPTPSQASPERAQEKTPQDVVIKNETMSPNEVTVHEGHRVTLRITSDEPLKLHLYGYDLEKDITANEPAELEFDATTPGRFQIENEQTDKQLGALLVQLP
jgi:hypothetical protein